MADDQWGYDDPFNRQRRFGGPAVTDELTNDGGAPTSPTGSNPNAPKGGTPGGGGLPGGSAAPVAPATYLGMTVPQWLQSALAVYGAYRGSQPGKFQQIPEDPSQTAARQKLLGFVDNSPTRDIFGNLIAQRLGAAHPFELPKSPTGYNPFPSGGGTPSYDLSAILPMLTHGAGQPATAPVAAGGVSDSVGRWLAAHPEIVNMGVSVAAGAVAQQFSIPQDQALQIVSAHLQGQRTPMMAGPAEAQPS